MLRDTYMPMAIEFDRDQRAGEQEEIKDCLKIIASAHDDIEAVWKQTAKLRDTTSSVELKLDLCPLREDVATARAVLDDLQRKFTAFLENF
jgi:hypothetical protein